MTCILALEQDSENVRAYTPTRQRLPAVDKSNEKNCLLTLKLDILKSPDYPANSSARRGPILINWPISVVRALTTTKVSAETPGYKNETPWRIINESFKVYEVEYQGLARWGPQATCQQHTQPLKAKLNQNFII